MNSIHSNKLINTNVSQNYWRDEQLGRKCNNKNQKKKDVAMAAQKHDTCSYAMLPINLKIGQSAQKILLQHL